MVKLIYDAPVTEKKQALKYPCIFSMWKFVKGGENDTTFIYYHDDRNSNENEKYYKLSNLIYGLRALIQIITFSVIPLYLNLCSDRKGRWE